MTSVDEVTKNKLKEVLEIAFEVGKSMSNKKSQYAYLVVSYTKGANFSDDKSSISIRNDADKEEPFFPKIKHLFLYDMANHVAAKFLATNLIKEPVKDYKPTDAITFSFPLEINPKPKSKVKI